MTRAKKFEATTYLRTDNLESIADLAHDLDVKAREYARGREGIAVIEVRPAPSISSVAISLEVSSMLPSAAAQTGRARPSSPTTRSGLSGSVTSASSSVMRESRPANIASRSTLPNGSGDGGLVVRASLTQALSVACVGKR